MQFKNFGIILIMLAAISCTNKPKAGQPGTAGQVKEYPVIVIKTQSTQLYKDYPTKLQGQQTVEIRSKITGYIEQILVDEGVYVRKGQLLFRLNDNDIQALVRSAEALVKVAEADVKVAQVNVEKTKPLVEKNIISKFDLESVESTQKSKEAQLAQAKANLGNANANLQYTRITSPADGTIGTFPFRVGSLVSSSTIEPLTTVSNTLNMYAYFSFNEKEFLTITKGLAGKNLQEKFTKLPGVSLIMADNSAYDKEGRIETASGLIDQQTGSVNVRASFPNPDGLLRSGGSGLVRIPQFVDSAIIIPQKTTYELQGKHFVYLVGTDNKVHNTEIEILVGNLKDSYVVTKGLNAGDKIVYEGIAALRNDTEIKPKLVETGNLSENMSRGLGIKK
ncbi:MAG TPA: efflux RND transporter periplasmic adaptor subunit [Prolixibacteraceae bacterium]